MSTLRIGLLFLWSVLHSSIYGFHITVLNGVQDVVICQAEGDQRSRYGLRGCLDLSDAQFGLIVSLLTLGGLAGSLSADAFTRKLGRIGTLRAAEIGVLVGTFAVGLANSPWIMGVGRAVTGFASGLILVSVPLHLSDVIRHRHSTLVGSLPQIFVGIGMLSSQALSVAFAHPWAWRYSLACGAGLTVAVFIGGLFVRDENKGETTASGEEDESSPLVRREDRADPLSVRELFTTKDEALHRAVFVVLIVMFAQQISGISPVMFFSTRILKKVFHAQSRLVALGMMATGIPFNFVPGILNKVVGTRRLLLVSATGTAVCSVLLALGLNMGRQALSLTGTIGFVVFFSIGLAPLPWVVLSEVLPPEARTSAGSIGGGVNWTTNFITGVAFLPLQQALQTGDNGEGNIFFVIAATNAVSLVAIWFTYRLLQRAKGRAEA